MLAGAIEAVAGPVRSAFSTQGKPASPGLVDELIQQARKEKPLPVHTGRGRTATPREMRQQAPIPVGPLEPGAERASMLPAIPPTIDELAQQVFEMAGAAKEKAFTPIPKLLGVAPTAGEVAGEYLPAPGQTGEYADVKQAIGVTGRVGAGLYDFASSPGGLAIMALAAAGGPATAMALGLGFALDLGWAATKAGKEFYNNPSPENAEHFITSLGFAALPFAHGAIQVKAMADREAFYAAGLKAKGFEPFFSKEEIEQLVSRIGPEKRPELPQVPEGVPIPPSEGRKAAPGPTGAQEAASGGLPPVPDRPPGPPLKRETEPESIARDVARLEETALLELGPERLAEMRDAWEGISKSLRKVSGRNTPDYANWLDRQIRKEREASRPQEPAPQEIEARAAVEAEQRQQQVEQLRTELERVEDRRKVEQGPPEGGERRRTYDQIQKQIDTIEDRLIKEGVDAVRIYDPAEHKPGDLPPEWKPMPPELARLYQDRTLAGAREMSENLRDVRGHLERAGVKDVKSLLDVVGLGGDPAKAIEQANMADAFRSLENVEWGQTKRRTEQLAIRRAIDRSPSGGREIDEFSDVPPEIKAEAAQDIRALLEFFHEATAEQANMAEFFHEATAAKKTSYLVPDIEQVRTRVNVSRETLPESVTPPETPGKLPPPGEVGRMETEALSLDPERFQFKLGTQPGGIHGELTGREYSPDLAGSIGVWFDKADGKTYVVNGHNRFANAVENEIPTQNVYHIKAATAAEARAKGALMNIGEGNGTPVDVGKFLRESGLGVEDLAPHGITRSSKLARQGIALANLDQRIFDQVALGRIPEARGIAIGEALASPDQQWAVLDLIEQAERRGRKVTDSTVSEAIRLAKNSGTVSAEQGGLFGGETSQSTALEKAEISDYIRSRVAKEKRLFSYASSEARAGELAKAGENVLDVKSNKAVAQEATQALEAYDRLSSYQGPINDILEAAAERIGKGENANAAKEAAYEQVRSALEETLGRRKAETPGERGREALPGGEQPAGFGDQNTLFTKDRVDEARKRIQGKLGGDTLTAGIDPTLLKDFAEVGGYYIEAGLREFGAWAERMIQDFGERIRPHLREVWAESLRVGRESTRGGDRAVFTSTDAADKTAQVEQMLRQLTEPSRTILEEGETTFERGTVRREIRDEFYGADRPGYEETYRRQISVENIDQARNMLRDAHDTTTRWLEDMHNLEDEVAIQVGQGAVRYLNQASKLFKETGTTGGRILQAFQRRARRGAGLPREERAAPGELPRNQQGGGLPEVPGREELMRQTQVDRTLLVEQARVLINLAEEQLRAVRTFRSREPVTTGLYNAIRDRRWNDALRYGVDQLRLNLFSIGSWALDAIGNASEMGAQGMGGVGHDLVYVSRSGNVTFPSLTGFVQAVKSRWRSRMIPMDERIEQAFQQTVGGELIGTERLFPPAPGRRTTTQERLRQPGAFTYRTTPASTALDLVQGIPLYAKGAMDTAAKRLSATAILYRDAIKAADAAGIRNGAQRDVFIQNFLEHLPQRTIDEAIREGKKAGFDRKLSETELAISRSVVFKLFGEAFPRWGFQFTRWAGEMLGLNPQMLSKFRSRTATPEEFGAYLAKTATGYGGLMLINSLLYDRTDFNSMEYVDEQDNRVRLSGREPIASALVFLALIRGDAEKAAAGLRNSSIPFSRLLTGEGGLASSVFEAAYQAARNPQNDPRALRRELETRLNRAIPGQALLSTIEGLVDPQLREGLGAGIPGYSSTLPEQTDPTTGEPKLPTQRFAPPFVGEVGPEFPSIQGTPIPGFARQLNPVEKLLNRFGLAVYRGMRHPIAGFPAAEIPPDMRREWEQEFGRERQRRLMPLAQDFLDGKLGKLEKEDEEKIRARIQRIDGRAARYAARVVSDRYPNRPKPERQPTLREKARPQIYQ